jgi:hypothetical protein
MMRWRALLGNDGSFGEDPLGPGSVGLNPTDREKSGSKNLLVDGNGIPLSGTETVANRHDSTVFEELLRQRIVPLD